MYRISYLRKGNCLCCDFDSKRHLNLFIFCLLICGVEDFAVMKSETVVTEHGKLGVRWSMVRDSREEFAL